jgi:hypothetical protein
VLTRRGADVIFHDTFLAFAGHYCFEPKVCWPYRPNEKGVVERPINYLKRNFWAGRTFRDFADLVAQGRLWLARANQRIHGTLKERPCDRFAYERAFLTPLPNSSFNTDWVLFPRVTKDCVVRVATNDYSVPWPLARQRVEVRVDAHTVRIYYQGQLAAEHARSYWAHEVTFGRKGRPTSPPWSALIRRLPGKLSPASGWPTVPPFSRLSTIASTLWPTAFLRGLYSTIHLW